MPGRRHTARRTRAWFTVLHRELTLTRELVRLPVPQLSGPPNVRREEDRKSENGHSYHIRSTHTCSRLRLPLPALLGE
jgi:hypothetical protein